MRQRIFMLIIVLLNLSGVIHANEPLTLDAYFGRVLIANSYLAQTKLRLSELDAEKDQIRAGWIPSISTSISSYHSRQGPRDVYLGGIVNSQQATDYEVHSARISLKQQLFDYGNSLRKIKSLSYDRQAETANYVNNSRRLLQQAQEVFFNLAEARELLALYNTELTELNKQQSHLDDLVRRGVKPPIDKLRFDVQINNTQARIHSQQSQIKQLQFDFAFYSGRPEFEGDSLVVPKLISGDSVPKKQYIEISPQMEKISGQIQSEELLLDVLQWDKLPDIYLNAAYDRGGTKFEKVYADINKDWNLDLSLYISFPLFRNHQMKIEEIRSRLRILRLEEQLDHEQKLFYKEQSVLESDRSASHRRYELFKTNVETLESIYHFEQERYAGGLLYYKDLTDTKQSLLQAKESLISLQYELLRNQISLDILNGQWDELILTDMDY